MKTEKGLALFKPSIRRRYSGNSTYGIQIQNFIEALYTRLNDDGLLGEECAGRLGSKNDGIYYQALSELLFANELLKVGHILAPASKTGGPDFCIENAGGRIWVEVICPKPMGIPEKYFSASHSEVINVPSEEILLRWTAAIKEKSEKLIGNVEKEKEGYLEKGFVMQSDSYVVAVNSYLLGRFITDSHYGISQYPYAVEAVFPVGPIQAHLDANSGEIVETRYQSRPEIKKLKGDSVPTTGFLGEHYSGVSAVWAGRLDESAAIPEYENQKLLSVVHNPFARCPVKLGVLPSHEEYALKSSDAETYQLQRHGGSILR